MNPQDALSEQEDWRQGRRANPTDKFIGCQSPKANLAKQKLKGIKFNKADLHDANLFYADMDMVICQDANLSGANMRHTKLKGADLRRTNLRKTDLRNADLSGADLSDADLRLANLHRANLTNTKLFNTIGDGVYIRTLIVNPEYVVTYTADSVQIGCVRYTRDQWLNAGEDLIRTLDGERAVTYWKQWKDIIANLIDAFPAEPTI